MLWLNVGSGQRRFGPPWVNVDCVSREGQVPDVVADAADLPYPDSVVDIVALHHVLEHFHKGHEVDSVMHEAYRVLRPGGSLLVFTPDIRTLAVRWLTGQLDDFSYTVQLYGAWQGQPGDDHHWNWSQAGLLAYVRDESLKDYDGSPRWADVRPFDWRIIPGTDFAKDWYIATCEATK